MRLDAVSDQGSVRVQGHLSRDLLPVLLLWALGFSLPKSLHAQRSLCNPSSLGHPCFTDLLSEMKLVIPPLCEGEKQPTRYLKGLGWGLEGVFSIGL